MDGFGQSAGAAGTAAELAQDAPGLELGVGTFAGAARDIANRDYWLSTAYDREHHMSFQFVACSSDNPPAQGRMEVAKSTGQGDIGVSPKVGLEKYEPRPTTK